MSFFTKQEIMERMSLKQMEDGPEKARAEFNLALIILGSALFDKRLKSGEDYGLHPVTVGMNGTHSQTKMIIGILHDVVEDSDWTVEDLRTVGFSERIVAGVDAMTRREAGGELYFNFVERCSLNADALDKKIEDLHHNMDTSRTGTLITGRDVDRTNKYVIAFQYLVAIKKDDIKAGSSLADFVRSRPDLDGPAAQALLAKHYKPAPPQASVAQNFGRSTGPAPRG